MFPYQAFSSDDTPLYLSPSLASGDGDTIDSDQIISEADTTLALVVNKDSYTALLSAALNGAVASYPDNWLEVIYPLIKAAKMTFCEQVADCIDSTVLDIALSSWAQRNSYGSLSYQNENVMLTPAEAAENLLPAGYVCDNDHLMGMARFVVQALHFSTLDVFEVINAISGGTLEKLSVGQAVMNIISAWGNPLRLVDAIKDFLYTAYSAGYTTVIEDDLSCALWCAFSDECKVSVDLIMAAYWEAVQEAGTPPASENLEDFVVWAIEAIPTMSVMGVVAMCHLLVLQFVAHSAQFGAMLGIRTLETIVKLGEDETDTSHSACDPCGLVPVTGFFDWVNVPYSQYDGLVMTPIWGDQTIGQGWYPLQNPDGSGPANYGFKYDMTLPEAINIDTMTWALNGTYTCNQRRMWLYNASGGLIRYISSSQSIVTSAITWNESGAWTGVKRIIVHMKVLSAPQARHTTVTIT